jgi:hypothetical protein
VQRTDNALLVISADGVEYLEQNHAANTLKRLTAQS